MEFCRHTDEFFPDYDNTTTLLLCNFLHVYDTVSRFLFHSDVYICFICFPLNVFHIVVLSRKSMRGASVNVLLMAIAVCDCCALFYAIYEHLYMYYYSFFDCFPPTPYLSVIAYILRLNLGDFFSRGSTWLLLCMALIRLLVIRNPLDARFSRLSDARFGVYFVLLIALVSGSLLTVALFQYKFIPFKYQCFSSKTEESDWSYGIATSDLFTANNKLFDRLNVAAKAIVSKLIPCVVFPIVTFLLIISIRNAEKKRKALGNQKKESTNFKTTQLVFFQTITFFFAEFPLGALMVAISVCETRWIQALLKSTLTIFSTLNTLNSISHMTFCLLISSQYREVASGVLCCGRCQTMPKTRKTSVISVVSVDVRK